MVRQVAMRSYRIALLPGDGIGVEVGDAAQFVLDSLCNRFGFNLSWDRQDWGCDYYVANGAMMPHNAIETLARSDAIFLGAVGRPDVPDHVSLWGMLIPIRRSFNLYANVRPVKSFPGVPSPLGTVGETLNFVIVRENSEGEYSEIGGRFGKGTQHEFALQEAVFTRLGVQRIAQYAADVAKERGSPTVVSATKSNGIVHTMPFWDEVVSETLLANGLGVEPQHIDALAARLVLNPKSLNVVVASNLFGDILSDLGSALTGGIGIGPSANLDPSRNNPSLFEPIHGSAPDIAGRGVANPVGQLWSGALMLEHLGEAEAANELMRSVGQVLASPETRTPDLGGTATTREVVGSIVSVLEGPSS